MYHVQKCQIHLPSFARIIFDKHALFVCPLHYIHWRRSFSPRGPINANNRRASKSLVRKNERNNKSKSQAQRNKDEAPLHVIICLQGMAHAEESLTSFNPSLLLSSSWVPCSSPPRHTSGNSSTIQHCGNTILARMCDSHARPHTDALSVCDVPCQGLV